MDWEEACGPDNRGVPADWQAENKKRNPKTKDPRVINGRIIQTSFIIKPEYIGSDLVIRRKQERGSRIFYRTGETGRV